MKKFYIHWNGAAWFVKEEAMFIKQGGLTQKWGQKWLKIEATSIEDAREKAGKTFAVKLKRFR